jgi:hypothetical protein
VAKSENKTDAGKALKLVEVFRYLVIEQREGERKGTNKTKSGTYRKIEI